jgi:multidrug/hemolysin transport system permease protein
MLAPLIVFFLYIVFLKHTYLSSLKESLTVLEEYVLASDIENIANSWLLAGLLGTSCITVSLNSLHVMVNDKNSKIDYDYNSSPIKGYIVVLSYFTGAFLNTFLITASILTVGLIILNSIGSLYLGFNTVILLYLVTILGCASSTILMMIIVSFFKKSSALGAFSGIVSAAVGFVIGAYIPLGNFSNAIQGILSLVPGSHVACLYRNLLMKNLLEHIDVSLNGMDSHTFISMAKEAFALNLNMFSYTTSNTFMMVYTSISAILALGLNIVLYKRTVKRY